MVHKPKNSELHIMDINENKIGRNNMLYNGIMVLLSLPVCSNCNKEPRYPRKTHSDLAALSILKLPAVTKKNVCIYK